MLLIKKFRINGKDHSLDGASVVVDRASGKTAADLASDLAGVRAALETFLNGEANQGDIDRLVELVAAINQNRDSIDALVSDKVAKADIINNLESDAADKVLSAAQGKALKALIDAIEVPANPAVLEKLGESGGSLTFDGKPLPTGIAITSGDETPAAFDGKVTFVVEELAEETSGGGENAA